MFVTTEAMRLKLASRLVPGVEVWDAVEIELAVPFLLVMTEEATSSPDAVINRTFLAKPYHLVSLAGASGSRISSVDFFSPPGLNQSGAWKLDPVAEVWECHAPGDALAWLYVLRDGRQFADSVRHSEPAELVRVRCSYKHENATIAVTPASQAYATHDPEPGHSGGNDMNALSRDSEFEQLVHVVQQLVAGSNDAQNFDARSWLQRWISEPLPALGNATPQEVLNRPGGFDRVCTLLRRMQSGANS